EPEIGGDDEIAVGCGGIRNRAQVDDRVELASRQPFFEPGRRDHVRELAFLQVAPLAAGLEPVADGNIGAAAVVEVGDHVRPDESGSAGYQQHRRLSRGRACDRALLCPTPHGRATASAGRGRRILDTIRGTGVAMRLLRSPRCSRERSARAVYATRDRDMKSQDQTNALSPSPPLERAPKTARSRRPGRLDTSFRCGYRPPRA